MIKLYIGPVLAVAMGKANIPAPIEVPAIIKIAPNFGPKIDEFSVFILFSIDGFNRLITKLMNNLDLSDHYSCIALLVEIYKNNNVKSYWTLKSRIFCCYSDEIYQNFATVSCTFSLLCCK